MKFLYVLIMHNDDGRDSRTTSSAIHAITDYKAMNQFDLALIVYRTSPYI
jgi:hypothetical protein